MKRRVIALFLSIPFTVFASSDELKMFDIMNTGIHALETIEGVERPSLTQIIDKSDVIVRGTVVDVTPYAHLQMEIPGMDHPAPISYSVALVVRVDDVMKGRDKIAEGNEIFVRRVVTWPGKGKERYQRLKDNLYKGQITMVLEEFDPETITSAMPMMQHNVHRKSKVGPGDTVYELVDRKAFWVDNDGKMLKPPDKD